MATMIDFLILVIVWEDEIYILSGQERSILKKLRESSFYDYLKEDIAETSVRLSKLSYLEDDLKTNPIDRQRLQSKGWLFKFEKAKISKEH